MERFRKRAAELNALPALDYEAVYRLKTDFLKESFRQNGAQVLDTEAFRQYFNENSFWLLPYAAYVYLREVKGIADYRQWGEYACYDAHEVYKLVNGNADAAEQIRLTYYAQFLLYSQMKEAHDYARSKGVLLKGDIPIGVCRAAVDVWMESHFFNRNGQAGAPPDAFSANGQNWGFPTYNWEAILQDGCRWWTRRLQKMSEFFDAYRIDHVLGFFRIWEIPTHGRTRTAGLFHSGAAAYHRRNPELRSGLP